jgi:hypothetical protein
MQDRDRDLLEYCDKPLVCTCHCGILARMVIGARDRAEAAEHDWQMAESKLTDAK